MKLPIYQIDAFAERAFEGNPAAVVPLLEWLPDAVMQAVAEENNLAETAFFVPDGEGFHIRWFTPKAEVKLCGHATLASAFVLFNELGHAQDNIVFHSLSGPLSVSREGELLSLDFPSQMPLACDAPELLVEGLGASPLECYRNEDYVAVFGSEQEVAAIEPLAHQLQQLDLRGVIVCSPSVEYDFVARFFAPKYGIPEDPVTGSAYTQLTPLWAAKTGKNRFKARQISARGGALHCELAGERVLISGRAVKYMAGSIEVDS